MSKVERDLARRHADEAEIAAIGANAHRTKREIKDEMRRASALAYKGTTLHKMELFVHKHRGTVRAVVVGTSAVGGVHLNKAFPAGFLGLKSSTAAGISSFGASYVLNRYNFKLPASLAADAGIGFVVGSLVETETSGGLLAAVKGKMGGGGAPV
jgi:hypothetical protein